MNRARNRIKLAVDISDLPNVAADFKRMQERPSVKKLLAHEKEVNEHFADAVTEKQKYPPVPYGFKSCSPILPPLCSFFLRFELSAAPGIQLLQLANDVLFPHRNTQCSGYRVRRMVGRLVSTCDEANGCRPSHIHRRLGD